MNTVIIVLIVITIITAITMLVFLYLSIKSKAYLSYKQKLIAFEEKKKRIEDTIEKDRKDFKNGS